MSNNIFFERGQMADKPNNYLWNGDCLELMQNIPDKSMDAIICDLPYGTTACKWDSVIPFETLWDEYKRIIKDNGTIVLFGSEPFSSLLRCSNLAMFKYDWVWNKLYGTNIYEANKRPMKYHELISVFYKNQPAFNKQMTKSKKQNRRNRTKNFKKETKNTVYGNQKKYIPNNKDDKLRNPKSILEYSNQSKECHRTKRLHPTQKPLELLKYLVKTHTNENDWVLDNTCGSNTTGIACYDLNRNYIGIEKDIDIYKVAKERMEKNILLRANEQQTLFKQ